MHSEARHPIAVVASRTGLSTDLLRVWERRYAAVTPTRLPNGQRLYSDDDIERLRLMSAAVRGGRTIARVAPLSNSELARLTAEDSMASGDPRRATSGSDADENGVIETAMTQTHALDAPALRDTLRRSTATLGVRAFAESVAGPFMRRVGDEWHAGRLSVGEEHLATAVLHDHLLEIVRGVGPRPQASRVIVATPPGERHVVGAAIAAATMAAAGWHVIYLGADLPIRDIAAAARATSADLVALSVVYVENREQRLADIRALREALPGTRIVVGGNSALALEDDLRDAMVEVLSGDLTPI